MHDARSDKRLSSETNGRDVESGGSRRVPFELISLSSSSSMSTPLSLSSDKEAARSSAIIGGVGSVSFMNIEVRLPQRVETTSPNSISH